MGHAIERGSSACGAGTGGGSDTALTSDSGIAFAASGLPNTFVPGRNLHFLTLAVAMAYRRGLSVVHLVIDNPCTC